MSLPAAKKDISTHPTKGSVVEPTNKALKDASVDRKIRLYGVINALRKGKLPSNAQIDRTLKYVIDNSPVDTKDLSPEGRKLIQDTRDIIATARLMVQEKNADELFQNFVWHTRSVDTETLIPGDLNDTSAVPVNGEKAQSEKDQALKHLRSLLNLVLTNSEVRKLLSDFSTIGRDLLSKGASKVADAIAPSEENLRNVDQSAPNDQFITEGGRVAGPNETPVLESRLPGTDKAVAMHPRADEAQLKNADGTSRPLGEVRDQAMEQYGEIRNKDEPVQERVADQAQMHAQEVADADSPEEVEEKKHGMLGRMRQFRDNVKEGINDRIPQQHKDTASDQFEHAKHFFSEEYFPEERRDQFLFRGKKVIVECQKHGDYQESIRWLLDFFEEYATSHGRDAAAKGKEHAHGLTNDRNLNICISELRTLLERFANGTSTDIIGDAITALIDDSRRDEGLRDWFRSVDLYIRKVLLEPGYVLEPDCNNQANSLREQGRQFYDEKYSDHFDHLFNSIGKWFKAMGEDPINHQFGEDWARLTKDLLFDSEGSLKFKPELWNDVRKVILPTIIEQVGYIPIPRIEYSDDSLDLVVENLTLQGRNLFPNIVALEVNNFVKFSPYNAIKDDYRYRIRITLEQMQADMRDVAFYYRKKTGIAKMKDSGIADVLLGGEGLSATIDLVSTRRDRSSVFRIHDVHVKIDTLKFAIRDSNHDFLYKTLRPLATSLIKRQIKKAIKDALTTGLEYVDGQLVAVRDRMEAANLAEGESRMDVLKDMFKQKKDEVGSVKSGESKSQFRIVSDKRDSLLSNQGHPSGWINRTADMEKVASQGAEWRSDVFAIV
ncbi:hypothetical protein BDZ97DRAFT_1852748 [Flammula alnicola]|nr:hypothetical protein BDZ97DRAFT_1852748 [Flammula alnicola]